MFETQYVYLETQLPQNPNLHGLGDSFRLPTENYQRVLWNSDSPFMSNLYGSQPNYLDHRGDDESHGVFILNSNGMNININRTDTGEQFLEYNTIRRLRNYSPFTGGDEKGVFLKADDGSNYRGVQWAGAVVWPDWIAPNTQDWWTDETSRFFDPESGIDIDGAWNDMNEASNLCPDVNYDPAQQAKDGNNPPHNSTGSPILGFPGDFQPDPAPAERFRSRKIASGQMKGLPDRDLFNPMYRASTTGAPVVNPVFFVYPADGNTFGIDTQFFCGNALMVSLVVDDDAESVTYYLPTTSSTTSGRWSRFGAKERMLL
ncbi:glycosyl hydrolases family 31-domain-containing protein [Hypoxylon cercidicola]|nr:glycosyl hydrolases family 31-domain-containing protein [Hypoxylon cercidicola]